MNHSLSEYCRYTGMEILLSEWEYEKNGDLTPDNVTYGSHKKVWWKCEKGHEWQAIIKSRISGCGCPVCGMRLLVSGINDLATIHPELISQWHPSKNGALRPEDVMPGTRRKVWWKCEKGHEWQAPVCSRSAGRGCPVCANKTVISGENDLASLYPEIALQWHESKNAPLTPQRVTPYSNRSVWWRCSLGHEYRTTVSSRTMRESGCPYCKGRRVLPGFNDLATLEPEIAAQWNDALNTPLAPDMVTVGSKRKVWWECSEGHVWKAVIYSRTGTRRCGCPVCAGKVKSKPKDRYEASVAKV